MVVSALAFCLLFALGAATYGLTPYPSKLEIEQLYAAFPFDAVGVALRPEPAETLTYVVLVLATPLALAIATAIQRRVHTSGGADALWALVFFAVGAAFLGTDENWRGLIEQAVSRAGSWMLASLTACVLIVLVARLHDRRPRSGPIRLAYWIMLTALVALAAAVTVWWRVFDVGLLDANSPAAYHYDAVAYSLAQIVKGGTCLYDVIPLYGCYGEFVAPLVKLLGYSTLLVTLLLALAQAVSLAGLTVFCRFLIRNPVGFVAATLGVVLVTNRIVYIGALDPGFANMPIRLLFPALSLVLVLFGSPSRRPALPFGWGLFAGAATIWNPDTGLVTSLALALLIVFEGCTGDDWSLAAIRRRWRCYVAFGCGTVSILMLAAALLSWKAGHLIDPAHYFEFQRAFVGTGFMMLPMPGVPSLWTVVAVIYLIPLAMIAVRLGRGPHDPRLERAGYLAVVAIGLAGYYVGRSHTETLMIVVWPAVILTFFLIERIGSDPDTRFGRLAGASATGLSLLFLVTILSARAPEVWKLSRDRWSELQAGSTDTTIRDEVAFITAHVSEDEPVVILAMNQATLYGEAGLRSAVPGPGWVETLVEADADAFIAHITADGPDHLFVGYSLAYETKYSNWVRRRFADIKASYALQGWNLKRSLMHLVRKDRHPHQVDPFASDRRPSE